MLFKLNSNFFFFNQFFFKINRKVDEDRFFNKLWQADLEVHEAIDNSKLLDDNLKDFLKKLSNHHHLRPGIEQAFSEVQYLKSAEKQLVQESKELNNRGAFENYFNINTSSNQQNEFRIRRKSITQKGSKIPWKFPDLQRKIIEQFRSENNENSSYIYLDLR